MKKTLIIGTALAASLLTACGSGTDGSASATSSSVASSSASSSASPSSSSSAAATTEETTMDETTADTSSTAEPVTLDEQSTAFFSTFCSSVTKIEESTQAMSSMKQDPTAPPADQQTALATGVTDFGNSFKTAAADISAVPPATIEGGDDLATGASTAFNQIGDTLIAAADKFAQTPVTDAASLQTAALALSQDVQGSIAGIQESLAPLQTVLTPELGVAVQEIPGCEEIAAS